MLANLFSDIIYYAEQDSLPVATRITAVASACLGLLAMALALRWTRIATAVAILTLATSLLSHQLPYGLGVIAIFVFLAALRTDAVAGAMIGVASVAWLVGIALRSTERAELVAWTVLMLSLISGFMGWTLGATQRRNVVIEQRAAQLEAQVARVRQRERQSLARELHDVVAHGLTLISMQATVLRITPDPAMQETARDAIERSSRESLEELRRLLQVLRASDVIADEAGEPQASWPAEASEGAHEGRESHGRSTTDLSRLVDRLADDLRAAGHSVRVECSVGRLAPSVHLAADRVLREATTNIVKHGGATAACEILVRDTPDGLVVEVANDIGGRAVADFGSTGLGVIGLTERVELLGGRLEAGPDGGRWRVRAVLPGA